ncbi:unnamed protein product [Phaedon cochleariae]|uniref:DNA polymerase zeta catalytic subunit n=1 Tax=Phaedon cochleariae TaxID=80249 RepID=A0A9P0DX40_PHACE|nr:unnamed protein product [Phaedon cochleariae]
MSILYSVRLVTLDSCMCVPIEGLDVMYSEFRGASVNQVPILRLYGSIPTGEKICVHIHGVFPYFYIPYEGGQDASSLMYKIAASIDKAVNISLNQASSRSQHVYKITLVSGIPMYGYHNRNHQFFKVYLYNPLLLRKVTSLLRNESTLGKLYQPHEAHLSFVLQFMIDYNLHGMSNMVLSKIRFREDPNRPNQNIDPDMFLPGTVNKMTVCELEGDCLAEDILNREEIASGNIAANPGIAALWADEQQRRRNKGEDSQIEHFLELERVDVEPTKSHFIYKQALRERLAVFSTEMNVVDKMNDSVYPAETPDDANLRNASMVDSQTPSSSLDETTFVSDLDETIRPFQDSEANMTLDQDALNLLELLNELESAKEDIEEDSILTQVEKEEEEDNNLDLSMAMEPMVTPKKIEASKEDDSEDGNDLWKDTIIPQLDGESGNFKVASHSFKSRKKFKNLHFIDKPMKTQKKEMEAKKRHIKKILYVKLVKCGRSMPDLDEIWDGTTEIIEQNHFRNFKAKKTKTVTFKRPISCIIGDKISRSNCRKKRKLTRKEKKERELRKTKEEIKKLGNRIKKINRQDQIAAIMKKLHEKENALYLLLAKNIHPKFRAIPKNKVKPPYPLRQNGIENNYSEVKIISDIIKRSGNYVEPTLYMKVRYPNYNFFLYNFNKRIIPSVTRIPRKLCSRNEDALQRFMDENVEYRRKSIINKEITKKILILPHIPLAFTGSENVHKYIDKNIEENEELIQTADVLNKNENTLANSLRINNLTGNEITTVRQQFIDHLSESNAFNENHKENIGNIRKSLRINSPEYKKCSYRKLLEIRSPNIPEIKNINKDQWTKKANYSNQLCSDGTAYLYSSDSNLSKQKNKTRTQSGNRTLKGILQIHHNGILVKNQFIINSLDGTVDTSDDEKTESHLRKSGNSSGGIETSPSRRSNRIKAHLLKCSLDGAIDSSSSEDEKKSTKRRRYPALPISITKSPSAHSKVPADTHLMSIKNTNCEEETSSIVQITSVCDSNVKRQLFTDDICLQSTIIEEHKACSYYPSSREKNILENVEDVSKNVQNNISDDSSVEHSLPDDNSSNESTIHADDNLNQSFFCSQAMNLNLLTTAEKYDKETKYHAKEGTSKVLTPIESNSLSQNSQVLNCSSESSSSGLITPYQRVKNEPGTLLANIPEDNDVEDLESSSTIFSSENCDISRNVESQSEISSECIVLAAKKIAPSRRDVIDSLEALHIPLVEQKKPFYSKVADVTGSIEVGFDVLKINSETSTHLPEFETQTDSLNRLRKYTLDNLPSGIHWRKNNIKNVILSFCKDRDCIIEPVKKPPTGKMVYDWINEKQRSSIRQTSEDKVKMHVPLNLGAKDDESDMDMSLTLTPCTPRTSQNSTNQSTIISNTPKSSNTSEGCSSPTIGKKFRKKYMRKKISNTLNRPLVPSQDYSVNQSCQITGVTIYNSFNRSAQNLQDARAIIEHQNLTVLVMELHVRTRGEFKPDPIYDSIRAIFYSILHDVPEPKTKPSNCNGVIAINTLPLSPNADKLPILNGIGVDCDIAYVDSEENLIKELLKLMTYWDPDILTGYEVELLSWGYIIERANVIGINLQPLLGRTKIHSLRWKDEDAPNELKIIGRIVLDVWRLMRHEIALQSYTFESVMSRILNRRIPHYPFKDLSFWWDHRTNLYRHRTVKYYLTRVDGILELFEKLDILGRTSELARLFGIQFYEVLSRGTQFRVESMMLRLAKPLNFIPVSPTIEQRAKMKAPEYIALVLEPESKLYNDPVIVLDFQSLYPSIIIAYNYCFTTCVGRVDRLGKNGPFEFGATQLKVSRKRLQKLVDRDLLNFAPCGVGYVKKEVRDGIMPRMLREILDTRLMVKNAMKENKDDKVLQRVLHNRQLGLKLIANVTYGYTAANFSGRMPSVEVGDSVVSKGRETLQRAIEMVENTPEWGARVVYGDTDSLFVIVPGKTKEHAFSVGKKIAEAVTNANPDPIKLKLEKVYQPCILQTKKRYVGYMYESPDQKEPVYEAKGIETVRRDGCPAVSKMLEKCLRILFETKDISQAKKYVLRQFDKIIAGRASIQDLIFAKEYRGAAGYRPGACVPALELTRKWTAVDKRNEPRSGERVPYIIVNGPPGLPLIRLVRSPRDLLQNPSLRPNAIYYITRVIIPPINRCFNLIGADLNSWFNQMPRKVTQNLAGSVSPKRKSTISQYFLTNSCAACGDQTQTGICLNCCNDSQKTSIILMEKMRMWERNHQNIILVCQSCTSTLTEVKCDSLDCPILYRRVQTGRDAQQVPYIRELSLSSDLLF